MSVGPPRAKIIAAGAPYVQDVVITGLNLSEVGALLFPTPAVRQLAGLSADAPLQEALQSAPLQSHLHRGERAGRASDRQRQHSSAAALHGRATLDRQGEVTDKGSINQQAVLKRRAALVDALYAGSLPSPCSRNRGREASDSRRHRLFRTLIS